MTDSLAKAGDDGVDASKNNKRSVLPKADGHKLMRVLSEINDTPPLMRLSEIVINVAARKHEDYLHKPLAM